MVQVDDVIVLFRLQFMQHQFKTIRQHMYFIDVGIGIHDTALRLLGKKMHFGIRHLLFQAAHNRRGKHDITDG